MSMRSIILAAILSLCFTSTVVLASPLTPTPTRKSLIDTITPVLEKRTDPTFPPSPPSCPICAQSYPSINSCAQAAPAFANFTQIIFNPGAFVDLIRCACTDTFQSAFPQCVDCFQQTNQTAVLDTSGDNLPSLVSGMRSVCALASTLLGNVTNTNGEQINGTPSAVPAAAGAIRASPMTSSVLLLNLSMAAIMAFTGSMML